MELVEYTPTMSVDRGRGEEKLRELILYIAEKCKDDPRFGATMLNKILFFSDSSAHLSFGQPITGVEYRALPNGPAPVRLVPNRDALLANGEIEILSVPTKVGTQHRVVPRRDCNQSLFDRRELQIVDAVISVLRGRTAEDVSLMSHGAAWRAALNSPRALIPYETVFVSDGDITEDDRAWATTIIGTDGFAS